MFRWKWFLAAVGVALLAVTWFLAAWSFEKKDAARAAAGDRLDRTRDAAARVVAGLIAETHAKLENADPKSPPPPLTGVNTDSGATAVTEVETILVSEPESWVRFGRAAIRVWRRTGAESYVYGFVPLDELRSRLEADPAVGTAGPGRWTRLEFVDVGGEVVFPRAVPQGAKRQDHGLSAITRAQRQIQARTASHRDDERLPEHYKDASDKLVLGSWAPVEGVAK